MERIAFLAVVSVAVTLPAVACGTTTHTAAPNPPPPADEVGPLDDGPCAPMDDACYEERLGAPRVGWLQAGLTPEELRERLGAPAEEEPLTEEAATGLWVGAMSWPDAGVYAYIDAIGPDEPRTLGGFTVTAPFDGATDRGITVGSSEAEVLAAYEGAVNPSYSERGVKVVAGSVYGGVIFTIEEAEVTQIFVGAAAE